MSGVRRAGYSRNIAPCHFCLFIGVKNDAEKDTDS